MKFNFWASCHMLWSLAFVNSYCISESWYHPRNRSFSHQQKLSVLKTTANAICPVDQLQQLLCSQFLGLGCSLLVHHSLRITSTLSVSPSALVTWVPGLPGRCNHVGHLRSHSSTCVPAQFSTEKVRVSWDLAESYTQCCLCSLSSSLWQGSKWLSGECV